MNRRRAFEATAEFNRRVRPARLAATQMRAVLVALATAAAMFVVVPPASASSHTLECDGQTATLIGTSGNDNLTGTGGPDVILGLGGNDKIRGAGGDDIICGGEGDDNINGGGGNDRIFGEAGADDLQGGNGDDYLAGGAANDSINGGNGNDVLIGAGGTNELKGGSGNDSCSVGDAGTAKQCENAFPTAVDDTGLTYTTDEDTALVVAAAGVLANDSDPDGDPLVVSSVNGFAADVGVQIGLGSGALLILDGDGSMSYDPNGQFESLNDGDTTTDGFDYSISDGNGGFDSASVTITIVGVTDNFPPDARDDEVTTDEDTPLNGDVLADNGNGADSDPDLDPLTVTEVDGNAGDVGVQIALASGALLTLNADGTFAYDPNGQFESLAVGESDSDTFTSTIEDPLGASDSATVTVTITGVNDVPTANDDAGANFGTNEDTAFTTGDVLANDTDPDTSDVLSVSSFDDTATVGVVTNNGDGTFGYDPNGQFDSLAVGDSASDTFDYTISDGNGGSDAATVTIDVTGVNDAPTITSSASQTAAENQTAVATLTAADVDVPAQTLTWTETGGADASKLSITAGGVLIFDAAPDFGTPTDANTDGIYEIEVQVSDGAGGVDTQTVSVTVNDVNDAPTITSSASQTAAENQTAVATLTATDADVPAQTLTWTETGGADASKLSITAGGVLTFDAAPDFETKTDANTDGIYEIEVTVTDNGTGSLTDVQTVSVTVTNENEAPTAVNDAYAGQPVNVLLDAGGATLSGVEVNDADGVISKGVDSDPDDAATLSVTQVQATAVPGGGSASATTAGGGTVTMNSDGTFTYVSELGETAGSDSFTYTLSDGALTDTATVTITLGDTIWFIDEDASGGANNGRSHTPFETAAAFNAATTGAGDTVFLGAAGIQYPQGITLQASQSLVGERSGLTSGNLSIAAGAAPVLAPGAGNGINLAGGNTVRGLDIGNTAGGTGIFGSNVGALTVSDVGISGTGGGVDLASPTGSTIAATLNNLSASSATNEGIRLNNVNGAFTVTATSGALATSGVAAVDIDGGAAALTVNATFASVSTTGGANGVLLKDIPAGTFTSNGGSISGVTNRGVDLDNVDTTVNIGSSIGNTTGRTVEVTNSSGTKTFSGAIDDNGSGINLDTNAGGTVTFSGGLALDTGSATGLRAVSGGTVNVTGANNMIGSSAALTGRAVDVENVTIGGSGVTFRSIAVTGAAGDPAIDLNTTGAGAFTVTGVGTTNGSGGTLQSINGDAVQLVTTGGLVTLKNMVIQDIGVMTGGFDTRSQHDGIHGADVNGGLALDNVTIDNISDMAINGALFSNGVGATVWNGLSITNSTITDSNRYHVAGVLDDSDEGSVRINGIRGTVTITGSNIERGGELIDFFVTAGTLNMTVTESTFNDAYKKFASGTNSSKGKACIDVTVQGSANANVTIGAKPAAANTLVTGHQVGDGGNFFRDCRTASIRVGNDTTPFPATGDIDVIVGNNTIVATDHNSGFGGDFDFAQGGVKLFTRGADAATLDGRISRNYFDELTNADGGVGQVTLDLEDGTHQVRVDSNTFDTPGNAAWEIRSDSAVSAAVLFEDNIYIQGFFTCSDPACAGGYTAPGLNNEVILQNGGNIDLTIRNEIYAGHDTGFDPDRTIEVRTVNVGGGGNADVFYSNVITEDGFDFNNEAGSIELYHGVSATTTGTCTNATPAPCPTVLSNNGNRGGLGVTTTNPPTTTITTNSVTITATPPDLPTGTIFN